MSFAPHFVPVVLGLSALTCTSYHLQSKTDGKLYVESTTTVLGLTASQWVLRCDETPTSRTPCVRLHFVEQDLISDADCRAANACRDRGECSARKTRRMGLDKVGEKAGQLAESTTEYVGAASQCVPGSDADCRASHVCRIEGKCVVSREVCVAFNDRDCAASQICKDEGRCAAKEGRCVKEGR